jgi:hypothetical protein
MKLSSNYFLLFVSLHNILFTVQSLSIKTSQCSSSRRAFFQSASSSCFSIVAVVAPAAAIITFPHAALAVPLLTDADEGRIHKIMMAYNPPPPSDKIQRPKLALDFAVLLTRSSYAETDQLDIIPFNQLERRYVSGMNDRVSAVC